MTNNIHCVNVCGGLRWKMLDLLLQQVGTITVSRWVSISSGISGVWITAICTITIAGHNWGSIARVCQSVWGAIASIAISRVSWGHNGNTTGNGDQAQEEKSGNLRKIWNKNYKFGLNLVWFPETKSIVGWLVTYGGFHFDWFVGVGLVCLSCANAFGYLFNGTIKSLYTDFIVAIKSANRRRSFVLVVSQISMIGSCHDPKFMFNQISSETVAYEHHV